MAVSVKVQAIDRQVIFKAMDGLTPEGRSKALAEYARRAIGEADAQNRQATGHAVHRETFVDGRKSADFERVLPNGRISAEYDLTGDLLQWIAQQLQLHAPFRRGRYRRSIVMFADGAETDDFTVATAAAEVVFIALVPYARKIERGESQQAPGGVFEAVAALAAQRYGNQAQIRFSYRQPLGGANALEAWAQTHSARHAKPRRQHARDVRQPAIVVTFR